jgi:hypothetical protein
MSSNKIKFKSIDDTMKILATAWEAGDWDLSRQAMTFICNDRPLEELEINLLTSIEYATQLLDLFVETGLDCAEDGTPIRDFYLRIVRYIFDNQTPEIKAAMDNAFHHVYTDLKPAGYDDNGQPCYSMEDVCEVMGCTEEEAMENLKGSEGMLLTPDEIHTVQ